MLPANTVRGRKGPAEGQEPVARETRVRGWIFSGLLGENRRERRARGRVWWDVRVQEEDGSDARFLAVRKGSTTDLITGGANVTSGRIEEGRCGTAHSSRLPLAARRLLSR